MLKLISMYRNSIFTSFLVFLGMIQFPIHAKSQDGMYSCHIETMGTYTTPGSVPFWFRSNQFGSVPLDKSSASLVGSFHKEYSISNPHLLDWGFGLEERGNLGYCTNYSLIEGYGKIKLWVFEFRGGRSKEIMGLCDTSLTSGAWSLSGTALGIPKIELRIPEFYTLPFFNDLLAFKGNFSHGWVGEVPVYYKGEIHNVYTWLHEKSLYGRFGKPEWRLKFYGGFNHQVFWGNEKKYHGDIYELSNEETYWKVLTGGSYGNDSILYTRAGNQLGSIDLGIEYRFNTVRLFAYHIFVYDIGAMAYLENLADGISGLSITNLKTLSGIAQWKKILFEFMYTKNQAGEMWSGYTASGDENYFNNFYYREGWSYQGKSLGNPFITPKTLTRTDLPCDPIDYFNNNRVVLLHLGIEAILFNCNIEIKASYSFNYGTFGTSEAGHSLGDTHYPPSYGLFGEKEQFSTYLSISRELIKGFSINLKTAMDKGELYYNSYGLILGASKTF